MPHSRESAERIRVFVALSLTPDTRRRLVAARDELGGEQPRIKWVSAENLHLTMKFVGEVSPEVLSEVNEAVRAAASLSPVASFTVRGLGRFPPQGAPRVIWAGVEERIPTLVDLHERLEDGLDARGIAREKKGFSPHVTLGRVRSKPKRDMVRAAPERDMVRAAPKRDTVRAAPKRDTVRAAPKRDTVRAAPKLDTVRAAGWIARVEKFLERNVDSVFGEEVVREISVIRSHLGRNGPRYEKLERFELTG